MPVRARVVERLVSDAVGQQWFDNSQGLQCKSMPTAEYHKTTDAADVLYERVVDSIDWPRVLIEAMSRHSDLMRLGNHGTRTTDISEDVCGSCIQEALLADDTFPRHSPVPLPRHDRGKDWLGTLMQMRENYGRRG
jgi:hypothetical protein